MKNVYFEKDFISSNNSLVKDEVKNFDIIINATS